MAIYLIDKIQQKNDGDFFLVDAEDVEYNGKSIIDALKAGEIIDLSSGSGITYIENVTGTTIPVADFGGATPTKGQLVITSDGTLYRVTAVDDDNATVEAVGASLKGDNAGFGTITATVDDKTGTPTVDASWDGPDTAKNLTLAFHNLKGDKGDKGDAFSISHIYASVEEMNSVFASDGVPTGSFVIITTEDPQDEDNGKVYVKGQSAYQFITDMSGEGIQGPAGTITISQTITGEPGTQASVQNNGTPENAQLVITIPRGDKGEPGQNGADGKAATVTVGETVTGAAGSQAQVENTGTESAAVLKFTIPQGQQGTPGVDGAAATVTVGSVSSGATAAVTNSGDETHAVLDFVLQKGDKGDPGQRGATITVGNGAPTELEGMVANDLYIDADTGDLYQFGDAATA